MRSITCSSRTLLLVAAAFMGLLQIVKGLSLEASLYPVMTSLFTYADGPVRRGLLPSLLAALGITDLGQIGQAYVGLHLAGLAVLLGLWLWRAFSLAKEGAAAPLILLLLLIASPVLPTLAATTGYSDLWLVLLLMATDRLLRRGSFVLAAGVVLLGTLQHEIMLVLALPLWIAQGWLQPEARRRLITVGFILYTVLFAGLMVAAWAQPALVAVAESRCMALRPAGHSLLAEVWDPYCVRHFAATLKGDFRPDRLILLPAFWLVYGLFPLALVVAGLGRSREGLSLWQGFCFVALGFVPYALIMLAWDSDRFILLSAVVGWRVLDGWYEAVPSTERPSSIARVLLALFLVFQLALRYPSADIYGADRLLPPAVSNTVFIDARFALTPLMHSTALKWPSMLDPAICIDPRCRE